ncbi:hypothetical protein OAF83_03820 [Rubripirellula sp.]|nr:hypothetical protein [Rubripirellula sp.]MDB4750013.1 hypothetical protein [Rubripirellula sp.]
MWAEKFGRPRGPGPQAGRQSNVDIAVLDAKGRVVHWFDAMPRGSIGPGQSLGQYTARQLARAANMMNLQPNTKKRPTILPDVKQNRGIRVFVTLKDDRMRAYQAPIVEVVELAPQDWDPLRYPIQPRVLDASLLKPWLSQVYPGGVMERTNQRTKKVYAIKDVAGELTLAPAGVDGKIRYSLLQGTVRLTDEGEDNFSYEGLLEIVLTYGMASPDVTTLRGTFDGSYPRYDRMHNRTRNLPLEGVFESRPE